MHPMNPMNPTNRKVRAAMERNWWVFALHGLASILFGIIALVCPIDTLRAVVYLFGGLALVEGAFAVGAAITSEGSATPRWALALAGLTGIADGIGTLVWPGLTALALLYTIAFWAVVTGVLEIVTAIRSRDEIENEWLMGLAGAVSVVFGLLLIAFPGDGAVSLIWLIGTFQLTHGVITLAFAIRQFLGPRLRRAARRTRRSRRAAATATEAS